MNKVVIGNCISETKILGSRFICLVSQISTIDEIESIMVNFKSNYPKADHYPYAYIFDESSKSSDDGEPSGTAGRQFLELLNKDNLNKTLIIVARYFGGSKLGVGRLTRTFVSSAVKSLDQVKKGREVTHLNYKIKVSYQDYEVLKNISLKKNIILFEPSYDDLVTVKYKIPKDDLFNEKDFKINFLEKEFIEESVSVMEEN